MCVSNLVQHRGDADRIDARRLRASVETRHGIAIDSDCAEPKIIGFEECGSRTAHHVGYRCVAPPHFIDREIENASGYVGSELPEVAKESVRPTFLRLIRTRHVDVTVMRNFGEFLSAHGFLKTRTC